MATTATITNSTTRSPKFGKVIVQSITGMNKFVCSADCAKPICYGAHPNRNGSEVSHPKWCLVGSGADCKNEKCPFNHLRTEAEFVCFRSRDIKWAAANWELLEKYEDLLVQKEFNREIGRTNKVIARESSAQKKRDQRRKTKLGDYIEA